MDTEVSPDEPCGTEAANTPLQRADARLVCRPMLTVTIHLLILLVFANRYILGSLFRRVRAKALDEALSDPELAAWAPTVAIVVPMFNEGPGIRRTIESLLEQDYDPNRLRIVVVDDCSTDDSHAFALEAARRAPDRVVVFRNPRNMGKRLGINRAVRRTESDIIVSVDSDVVVQRDAVRQLVRRFVRPEIAAVGGRVNVLNKHDNWLTRMQTIKYYYGYEYLKNLERSCRTVMCLSGCLTAYRRSVLLEIEPVLENRRLFGIPIKYGEDRFLTRQLVKAGHQTVMTLDAVSHTVAPNTLSKYFSQQLRWRRSNIVDYLGGLSHAWTLHPLVSIHYFSLFALLMAYPAVIVQSLAGSTFWDSTMLHASILATFGWLYRLHHRGVPKEDRVGPLDFLAMALVMPVTYVLMTPLALFTLDCGSWETRGHRVDEEVSEHDPEHASPNADAVPARPATS